MDNGSGEKNKSYEAKYYSVILYSQSKKQIPFIYENSGKNKQQHQFNRKGYYDRIKHALFGW